MTKYSFLSLLWLASAIDGQNLVNLQTQTKNVNFSNAVSTIPAKSGTALPATCGQGELYFLTSNPAGQNLYGCTSSNTWTLFSGGGGGSGTVSSATAGQFGFYSANGSTIGGHSLVASDIPALNYQGPLAFSGNASKVASATGLFPSNDCVKWDANGNVVDAGAVCGVGTVGTGTVGQFALYSATGSVIGGHTLAASDIPSLSYQAPLTFTGNGLKTASSTGSYTANDCVKWDTNGNVVDAGAACGSGGSGNLPSQNGTAGILMTNGSVASWGNVVTGGSGALDCSSTPGVCDLVTAVVPFKASLNTWVGYNDFSGAPALRLVSQPGVPSGGCAMPTDVGKVYTRNDAAAANSTLYLCSKTSATNYAWELVQSTGGSGGSNSGIPAYNASGALQSNTHIVTGSGNFSGYVSTITFSGSAAFSSATNYVCSVSDTSGGGTPVGISITSGTSVSLTDVAGAGNNPYIYFCVGN